MALKIRASGQLNGTVNQLSCTISAKTLVWTGTVWELQATSNPAWWFLNFCRGRYNSTTGLLEYGAGLADADIDIELLKTWRRLVRHKRINL